VGAPPRLSYAHRCSGNVNLKMWWQRLGLAHVSVTQVVWAVRQGGGGDKSLPARCSFFVVLHYIYRAHEYQSAEETGCAENGCKGSSLRGLNEKRRAVERAVTARNGVPYIEQCLLVLYHGYSTFIAPRSSMSALKVCALGLTTGWSL
jgi:hypothetical protein